MALVTQTAIDPAISPNVTDIPAGTASGFRTTLNTTIHSVEDKAQLAVAFIEELQAAIGNGALSGGEITAGVGLSVSVAALKALVGHVVEFDASQTVGGLTAASTNYLWLREDGTWTANTTGTKPSDDTTHGDALLWGTATTDGSGVTAVSNNRDAFRLHMPFCQQRERIKSNESTLIGYEMQVRLWDKLTVSGTLTCNGRLRIDG
jgi:hypothetical protein